MNSLADESGLLLRVAKDDKEAFTLIFNHYQPFVYSFARKLTYSDQHAIDIVQDVFLKIWERRATLQQVDNFASYLNRVVRNHSFNVLRDLISKERLQVDLTEYDLISDESTLQRLDYNDAVRLVNDATCLLSAQQLAVYDLCHKQGLKYEEAAEVLAISPQTVHVHMKLALRKIREHLKANGIIYPLLVLILIK